MAEKQVDNSSDPTLPVGETLPPPRAPSSWGDQPAAAVDAIVEHVEQVAPPTKKKRRR